jgi:hypothetical protein
MFVEAAIRHLYGPPPTDTAVQSEGGAVSLILTGQLGVLKENMNAVLKAL